jgi:hypothetical protein
MNCRKEWSHTFLSQHLSLFMKTEYREKREVLLFEKEKATIPSIMVLAEQERNIRSCNTFISHIQQEIIHLYSHRYKIDLSEWRHEKKQLKATLRQLFIHRDHIQQRKLERKTFIMKCVVEECRGFLSTRYKCNLCFHHICPDCHIVIKETHVCNPDTVATITELKKSTKPCPSCHTPIFKTEGCDQMWCIQCHTAFSWKSGQIEKGIIHNPHYFEFIKQKGALPRNPMDIPCGGLPHFRSIYEYMISKECSMDEHTFIRRFYEEISHHREVTLATLPHAQEQVSHTTLMIQYILQDISEKQCKQSLFVREQKRSRGLEERQILESYLSIGEEVFRKLISNSITFDECITEIQEIKTYTIQELHQLDERYQHKGFILKWFLNR